jgi:hypothetical protein
MLAKLRASVASSAVIDSANIARQAEANASTTFTVAYGNRADSTADNQMFDLRCDSVALNRGKAQQRIAWADDGEVELLATTLVS